MVGKDYTVEGVIIRGSRWPAVEGAKPVEITSVEDWPPEAEGWAWSLIFSRGAKGGKGDVELLADVVDLVTAKKILCLFHMEPGVSITLPESGSNRLRVDIKSDDGSPDGAGINYYDCVAGTAAVRSPAGQGP